MYCNKSHIDRALLFQTKNETISHTRDKNGGHVFVMYM